MPTTTTLRPTEGPALAPGIYRLTVFPPGRSRSREERPERTPQETRRVWRERLGAHLVTATYPGVLGEPPWKRSAWSRMLLLVAVIVVVILAIIKEGVGWP